MKNRHFPRSRSSASAGSFSLGDAESVIAPINSILEELQNPMSIIKTDVQKVISEHLACSVAKYMFELLEEQNENVPQGLFHAVPEIDLLELDDVEYVEPMFSPEFQDIHKILGKNRKRSRTKSRTRMHKIIRAIEIGDLEELDLKKELCWLLAYRQLVRDRDGYSENFGIIEHADRSKHIGIIDMGLANRNIGECPRLGFKDFHDKGFIAHKLQGEASPNHLVGYHKLYLDPEFKKATEAVKEFFSSSENQGKMLDNINSVLEEIKQAFGQESVEEYKTKWCKIDKKIDLASALCSLYQSRSKDFEESISKLQTRLKNKIKKSKLLTEIAQGAVEGVTLMSNLRPFPMITTTAFIKTTKSQRSH
jgi:hypothetical protein